MKLFNTYFFKTQYVLSLYLKVARPVRGVSAVGLAVHVENELCVLGANGHGAVEAGEACQGRVAVWLLKQRLGDALPIVPLKIIIIIIISVVISVLR
jgi:hypothetical protein